MIMAPEHRTNREAHGCTSLLNITRLPDQLWRLNEERVDPQNNWSKPQPDILIIRSSKSLKRGLEAFKELV